MDDGVSTVKQDNFVVKQDNTCSDDYVVKKYIIQLHDMINDAAFKSACGWEEDGLSIYVFDNGDLRDCLNVNLSFSLSLSLSCELARVYHRHIHMTQKYYQTSNFKSLARQLHLYGFRQIKSHRVKNKYVTFFSFYNKHLFYSTSHHHQVHVQT